MNYRKGLAFCMVKWDNLIPNYGSRETFEQLEGKYPMICHFYMILLHLKMPWKSGKTIEGNFTAIFISHLDPKGSYTKGIPQHRKL